MKRVCFLLLIISFLSVRAYAAPVPVINADFTPYQLENVNIKQCIIKGCHSAGWSVVNSVDNVVTAKHEIRKHEVVVDIIFSEDSYEIIYKDSKNMDYVPENLNMVKKYTHAYDSGPYVLVPAKEGEIIDEKDRYKREASIHKNYGRWVRNLSKKIKYEIENSRWE